MAKKPPYEGSALDRKADLAAAKKAGMSAKKYEGSAADRRADAAAMRRRSGAKRGR